MNQKVYYEFVDQEYYALVTVTIQNVDKLQMKSSGLLAAEVYAKVVGGESAHAVLEEGLPKLRTKEYAFEKFIRSAYKHSDDLAVAIKEFDELENNVLLIDGSLI